MEQAAAGAITSLLPQLGIAGIGLLLIGGLGFWWLRASKDLREEKEGVIGRQNERIRQNDRRKVNAIRNRQELFPPAGVVTYPGIGMIPREVDGKLFWGFDGLAMLRAFSATSCPA